MRCLRQVLTVVMLVGGGIGAVAAESEGEARSFSFDYGAELQGLRPGAKAKVWFPIAKSNPQQDVQSVEYRIPAKIQVGRDAKYANEIGFFEWTVPEEGGFTFGMTYQVVRREAVPFGKDQPLSEQEKSLFLSANAKVPVELIANGVNGEVPSDQVKAGQFLFDVVEKHMKYDKSKPGYGNGDAVWACDSRTGNCTDFHSLFISLARNQSIAAKFEIGFPLPPNKKAGEVGGYHCWAWFHSDSKGWFPVDISEADKHPEMKQYYFGKLTADRMTMSVGRDIELVPKSENGPLNYFVYPHVEVDGEVIGKEKMKGRFSFSEEEGR